LQLKKIGVIESSEIISRAAYHNSSTFRDGPLSGKLNWGKGGPSPKRGRPWWWWVFNYKLRKDCFVEQWV